MFGTVDILETDIACALNAQDGEPARIDAEIQGGIDVLEKEIPRYHEIAISKHGQREKRVAAVRKKGRARLGELQRKLTDAKNELALIMSPILILPYEVTAEFFNWHMLMGGNLTTMQLVCKRWTMVAYSSP